MVLRQTPLLDLLYDPTTDILRLNLPDFRETQISEVGKSLEQMKSIISEYFISRLLLDGSLTSELLDTDHLIYVWQQLIGSVSGTRLQKIARIRSHFPAREALAEEVIRLIDPASAFPHLQFDQFETEAEAVKWLLEEQPESAG